MFTRSYLTNCIRKSGSDAGDGAVSDEGGENGNWKTVVPGRLFGCIPTETSDASFGSILIRVTSSLAETESKTKRG